MVPAVPVLRQEPAAVDFVVCTRNNREVIAGTLRALAQQQVAHARCIVVDGRSEDGTAEYVAREFPGAEVVVKRDNSGPAASRNLGIARSSAEYCVLVDSDVELASDWTEKQLALMRSDPAIGIAGGPLVYASDPARLNAGWGAMNRYGVAWEAELGKPVSEFRSLRRCLWVLTAAVMVRRSMWARIGGFDELMFGLHEDSDFGWRASLCGYKVVSNPQCLAYHRAHSSFHEFGARLRLLHRNRLRSMLVNYGAGSLLRYTAPFLLLSILDALARPPRWSKLLAVPWNLRHLPDTLRRRREVQRLRTVDDRDLWELFEPGMRGPGHNRW
jgi:GT2 family glycosyltransferase